MRKPTMQSIADAVGVSRITVWKALSGRPGVSDALRRQIADKAALMGYTPPADPALRPPAERTVSVVVARPESSSFWMQIIHHIAKELARGGVNLMYTYMPTSFRAGYELPPSLQQNAADGFIVLNIYDERLLRMLAASPLPKVFLDTVPAVPPELLGGDLVLLEGRTCVREITARLLQSGRKALSFIGDTGYARTNYERYLGFEDAHAALGLTPDARLCFTGPIGLRSHLQEIAAFIHGLSAMPDAFVCPSDFIADFVQQALDSLPHLDKSPVITGFDNNSEYPHVARRITTVDVQTASLGKRLANKILFRTEHPDASPEVSYVHSDILYRGALAEDAAREGLPSGTAPTP